MLTFGSLFAGIGGFDLGFERAGFRVVWQVENDGKAQSVLSLRFPNAALHCDVRTANGLTPVDVICGGFPCQDVSVAGTGKGLAGERTWLFWQIVRIARELQPRWMVLENVPGLLSSHGGRDFHAVLSALADIGFRRAYRILDSRYFGVAQRRRRVFIVLRARRLGDGPETVLFESASSEGDSQTRGEARSDVAATLKGRSHGAGVNMPGRGGEDDQNLVYALRSNERNTSQGPGNYVPVLAGCLNPGHEAKHSYAGDGGTMNIVGTLNSGGNSGGFRTEPGEHLVVHSPTVQHGVTEDGTGRGVPLAPSGVRRLTPLECERLQGFPDGWTCLCGKGHLGSSFCECAGSPRYRQLGNAVTVPVAEWIARRIAAVEL